MEQFFGDRTITLYASGTAALAEAIARCAARSSATAPEVIIPAYGCPNLVAACVHASVRPRLVEVMPSQWAYDPEALKSNLSHNTVAILAVNLLGVGDSASTLRKLCDEKGILLIQDSAQHLPRQITEWPGDYVILSFGRGKPLNLLHGGALIQGIGSTSRLRAAEGSHYSFRDSLLASRTAALAFNFLTRPHIYGILSAFPGTGLGQVTYVPLQNAAPLPESAWLLVGDAFDRYRQKVSYQRLPWASALKEWSTMGIEPLQCPNSDAQPEPVRLALLAPDRSSRDALVRRLNRKGLGASRFYGSELARVRAVPEQVQLQGPFRQAAELADRLFTLPTHALVATAAVEAARIEIYAWRSKVLHTT